ncbi:hypothetical protein Pmani_032041 [Petrolisthes manimaculis]|uniref:Uncharacterized protein n=1 Tax=Petrolisthes manimaculis TaxID=1843537 RepID=A0AAE1NUG3_9EUCA|nr:hypothetical protein Pmani_032041 [Petrolisthes manimaculis]
MHSSSRPIPPLSTSNFHSFPLSLRLCLTIRSLPTYPYNFHYTHSTLFNSHSPSHFHYPLNSSPTCPTSTPSTLRLRFSPRPLLAHAAK